jgi:hypothetical protein
LFNMAADPVVSIKDHEDAVHAHNRFGAVNFRGSGWDLSHLCPFAMCCELDGGLMVDVVVLFSCHCFTQSVFRDGRERIPSDELYRDGRELRVLDPERYRLSLIFLPRMIHELHGPFARRIRVSAEQENFFTLEAADSEGTAVHYAVFFAVEKDRNRKKRLLLRVQSAYPLVELTNRQRQAGKVNFNVLLQATYAGRRIRR